MATSLRAQRGAEHSGPRRDARALTALADLLLADDVQVRVAAAAALRDGPGAAIAYDPQGPAEQRIDAASRLRSLHNRAP